MRAIMITGAGRGFSSGADLGEQRSGVDGAAPDLSARLRELYNPIILSVREIPKPVIAAVNGPAAGIGCSLALACDLIVAAESAFFLLAFVNIGLVPDGGVTAVVPARAGAARAAEMAMLGERVPAAQALEWGLINRVVADDELEREAGELLAKLAAGPTRAYANIKRLLNRTPLLRSARATRGRGRGAGRAGANRRLRRGRDRLRREAPAAVQRQLVALALILVSGGHRAGLPRRRRIARLRLLRGLRLRGAAGGRLAGAGERLVERPPGRCRADRRRIASAPGAPGSPRRSARRRRRRCRGCRARSCRSARRRRTASVSDRALSTGIASS